MYQLGLSPESTPEAPRMSFAVGANRWASKVVVVLQLAAWTAIGIVLLQKGVASLPKNSAEVAALNARNSSKVNLTDSVSNLLTKKYVGEGEIEEEDESMELSEQDVDPEAADSGDFDNVQDPATTTTTTTTTTEKPETEKKRTGNQNLNVAVGRGTAAAAVAMVAVGAVMLALGPAVMILRALDERRQERRFLKLSGQDDLPPSYEQATLMDEAPRYSTLSLNTINNCSTIVNVVDTTSANDRQSSSATVAIINADSSTSDRCDAEEAEACNSEV